MLTDTLQYVDHIGVGVDAAQSAGDQQALHAADVFGAELGPAKHPRLASHRDRTQGSFQMVGVDRHLGVSEEDLQPSAPFARLRQCLGERVARQQALP